MPLPLPVEIVEVQAFETFFESGGVFIASRGGAVVENCALSSRIDSLGQGLKEET